MTCMLKALHYCLIIYLKTLETIVLKYMNLTLLIFFPQPDSHWQVCLKKTGEEFEILTNTDMLLMAKEGIRSGKSQAIHRYTKASNKYMKKCNKNTKSLYLTRI